MLKIKYLRTTPLLCLGLSLLLPVGAMLNSYQRLLAVCAALLIALTLALLHLSSSIQKRQMTERQLRKAKEDLEDEVARRTAELVADHKKRALDIEGLRKTGPARDQAQHEAQLAKDQLEAIFRSVTDGMLVLDHAQRILLMNPAAETLLGCRLCEVRGQALVLANMHSDIQEQLSKALAATSSKAAGDIVLSSQRQDAPECLRVRTSALESHLASGPGRLVLLQDVAGEYEVERMKNEFLAMTTHELKTPLTAILGYAELLQEMDMDPQPEDVQAYSRQIVDKAESLSRLIDDLLDVSQVAAGEPLPLTRSSIQVDEIIRDLASQYLLRHPRHRFEVELPHMPVTLSADRGRIIQVLENLIGNAIKYSPRGSSIRIGCTVEPGHCSVWVQDQGIGLAPEHLERVFDTFYRVDSSDTAVPGTGLGLSVCRLILAAHGGQIGASSEQGQGTRVWFTLPLRLPHLRPAPATPAAALAWQTL